MQNGRIGYWRDSSGVVREMPMHGLARHLPFCHEIDKDGRGIRMILKDSEQTQISYPFHFEFEAAYRLLPDGFEASLSISNLSDKPMPYHAGHHFYFVVPHTLRGSSVLDLPPSKCQYQNPDGSLTPAANDKASWRLDEPTLSDCFHVLQKPGTLQLHIPGEGIEIAFDLEIPGSVPWYAVTTWTEKPDSDFYCIEPWLGLPNAIHHGQGLRQLGPDQKERAICRISLVTAESRQPKARPL